MGVRSLRDLTALLDTLAGIDIESFEGDTIRTGSDGDYSVVISFRDAVYTPFQCGGM